MSAEAKRTEVDRRWAERGWPSDLLGQARRLHVPEETMLRWFSWSVPLERAQEEVEWAEKL